MSNAKRTIGSKIAVWLIIVAIVSVTLIIYPSPKSVVTKYLNALINEKNAERFLRAKDLSITHNLISSRNVVRFDNIRQVTASGSDENSSPGISVAVYFKTDSDTELRTEVVFIVKLGRITQMYEIRTKED